LRASQELPPLPAPALSPPHTEPENSESIVNAGDLDSDHRIAPQDIDLELDERNIVPGKRRRTQSSRAADANATVTRPTKRGLYTR
jgi:hypothetical protein